MKTLSLTLTIILNAFLSIQMFAQNSKCIEGDCKNGIGVYLWEDGTRYEGTFSAGEEIEGTYYYPDSAIMIIKELSQKSAADFAENIKWEKTYCSSDSATKNTNLSQKFASGCVAGDCQNGIGTFVWEETGWYEGNFKNNEKSGYGAFYWQDRSKYVGEWLNNKRHGEGVYQCPNLTTTAGIWKDGYLIKEDTSMKIPPNEIIKLKILGMEIPKNASVKLHVLELEQGKQQDTMTSPVSSTRSMEDVTGPEFVIIEPEPDNDLKIVSENQKFTLRGYVADPANVVGLWVNDQKATLRRQGGKHTEFEADIEIELNTDQIIIEAVDGKFNKSKEVYTFELADKPIIDLNIDNDLTHLQRTALVIGNSSYTSAPLKNAVNDAKAITQKLEEVGFEVFQYTDLDHQSMENAINEFGKLMDKRGGVALFYFAGHGVQVGGENYLIPVKSNIQSEKDIKYKTVNLGYMLDEFDGQNSNMNIIILDACRNNPFSRYRSITNGLTPTTIAPSGTFIAYSTSPGSVASDGDGTNGLYTQELIKQINAKGKTIEQVFKKVRANVRQLSAGSQIPWEISSIEGDFYFTNE